MGSIAPPNVATPSKQKVLSPAAFAHVALRTPNLQPMVDFYLTFLGGKVSYGNDVASFITYDEEHHRIALIAVPDTGPRPHMSRGQDHMAFTYRNLTDLLTSYKQRKANGLTPVWSVNHGPSTSLYYKDPDGNVCETSVDNLSSVEEINAYLASPEFDENPFGADIDPEDWIARLETGENEAVLKKRVEVGPRGPPDFESM